MEVSILTENTVYKRGFLAEHGLSLYIETEKYRFLFDTGQSRVFLHNAKKLGIDLAGVDGIIMSHGHYDHCGGLGAWMEQEDIRIPVYINKDAFDKKYTQNPKSGEMRYIGMDWCKEDCRGNLRLSEGGKTEILPEVFLVGGIPYHTAFEPYPKLFWRAEGERMEPDLMKDEQLLVLRTEKGLHVFAGCAHAGIVNCLEYVRELFEGERIYSLMAGMHLKGVQTARVSETIKTIKEMEIKWVVPLHCTGMRGIAAMKQELGERCILAEAGRKLNF